MSILLLIGHLLLITDEPQRLTLDIDGVKREALVYSPSQKPTEAGAPLVLAYHGHGGTARYAANRFGFHKQWPEAVVVYPQGLTGVAGITDPEGKKSGWQKNPGEQGDRDVKFFDALLTEIVKHYKIDANRIYVMGHSNGSRFACVLWNMRGDKLASLCMACGQGGRLLDKAPQRSVIMIAGEKDPLVPYDGQMLSINAVRKAYACDAATAKKDGYWQVQRGKDGLEVATYLHPGGHEFPTELVPKIVDFWKRQVRPAAAH